MSGSSHAFYFCTDTGVGHYFFLSLITSWWQIDQGFTAAGPWAGVVWASHPRKEKPSWCCPLDRSKPSQDRFRLGTNISPFLPHLGLRLRGAWVWRGNRMAEKHFWKLKVKTWQWKSCYSCLTCGLWMAQCPIKPFSLQLKIAQASLLIVLIATIFKASTTIQTEALIQR